MMEHAYQQHLLIPQEDKWATALGLRYADLNIRAQGLGTN